MDDDFLDDMPLTLRKHLQKRKRRVVMVNWGLFFLVGKNFEFSVNYFQRIPKVKAPKVKFNIKYRENTLKYTKPEDRVWSMPHVDLDLDDDFVAPRKIKLVLVDKAGATLCIGVKKLKGRYAKKYMRRDVACQTPSVEDLKRPAFLSVPYNPPKMNVGNIIADFSFGSAPKRPGAFGMKVGGTRKNVESGSSKVPQLMSLPEPLAAVPNQATRPPQPMEHPVVNYDSSPEASPIKETPIATLPAKKSNVPLGAFVSQPLWKKQEINVLGKFQDHYDFPQKRHFAVTPEVVEAEARRLAMAHELQRQEQEMLDLRREAAEEKAPDSDASSADADFSDDEGVVKPKKSEVPQPDVIVPEDESLIFGSRDSKNEPKKAWDCFLDEMRSWFCGQFLNHAHCDYDCTDLKCVQRLQDTNIEELRESLISLADDELRGVYEFVKKSWVLFNFYLPTMAEIMGIRRLIAELLDAISICEQPNFEIGHYQWLVHGLINAGLPALQAIALLMEHRSDDFPTSAADYTVLRIIFDNRLASEFLRFIWECAQPDDESPIFFESAWVEAIHQEALKNAQPEFYDVLMNVYTGCITAKTRALLPPHIVDAVLQLQHVLDDTIVVEQKEQVVLEGPFKKPPGLVFRDD